VYIGSNTIAACIGYSASCSENLEKPTRVFERGENLLQNDIQHTSPLG